MKRLSKTITIIMIMLVLLTALLAMTACYPTDVPTDSTVGKYYPPYQWADLSFTPNDLVAMGYSTACDIAATSVVGISYTHNNKTFNFSGFIISPDGYILTFCKALPQKLDDIQVMVTTDDSSVVYYTAEVVHLESYSNAFEPALLKIIDAPNITFDALAISDVDTTLGSPCIVMGNVNNNFLMAVSGSIGRAYYALDIGLTTKDVMLINAGINPSYVGSPVINFKGEVIGMITGRFLSEGMVNSTNTFDIGYALKAIDIKAYLDVNYPVNNNT